MNSSEIHRGPHTINMKLIKFNISNQLIMHKKLKKIDATFSSYMFRLSRCAIIRESIKSILRERRTSYWGDNWLQYLLHY